MAEERRVNLCVGELCTSCDRVVLCALEIKELREERKAPEGSAVVDRSTLLGIGLQTHEALRMAG